MDISRIMWTLSLCKSDVIWFWGSMWALWEKCNSVRKINVVLVLIKRRGKKYLQHKHQQIQ